jgi:hypothetical protein
MSEKLDEKVDKMPQPEFIEVSSNSRIAFTVNESLPIALTINWQWVLAKITEALIARDSLEAIKLLFLDGDYIKINNNAVEDIRRAVGQAVDENVLRETQAKINLFKELMSEYLHHPETNQPKLDYVVNESSLVVQLLKSLEIVGVGAFMIASGFRLALLQEKAKSDRKEWSNVKDRAIEYSQHAENVTPKLFELSVGRIDKECRCKKWKSGFEFSYECSYFDGKDLHIFRETNQNAANECNKHRLQMFYNVTNSVNQTIAQPVREASKKWLELAVSN